MATAFLIIGATTLAMCGAIYRNVWVYRARVAILAADFEAYRTLPTHDAMVARFWIWDASRFLGWHPSHVEAERRANAVAAERGAAILRRNAERSR
jgi:hypothetical protein